MWQREVAAKVAACQLALLNGTSQAVLDLLDMCWHVLKQSDLSVLSVVPIGTQNTYVLTMRSCCLLPCRRHFEQELRELQAAADKMNIQKGILRR